MLLRLIGLLCLLCLMPMSAQASIISPGDVAKAHVKEEADCEKCHKKFDKGAQSKLCGDCHKNVAKDIVEKRGYHGRLQEQKECKSCHTDHKGRDYKIVTLDTIKFDHAQTDYALKGGHTNPKVKCEHCHKAGKKYSEAPSICNDCHKKDDKHKGGLGTDCAKCHVEKDWKTVSSFDHDKTKFKLRGKHDDVKCDKCHINNKFKDTPMLCNACHKKDDTHKGKFGPKCETCHVDRGWKQIVFDHDKLTKYPLLGKHKDAKCVKCHTGDLYKDKLKSTCVTCHKKEDDKAHKGNFGPKCETCHVERDWKEIIFDHGKLTKYPLLGKHKDAKCVKCHTGDLYKDKLKMTCVSCHKKEDDKAHKGNFGAKCETCHVEKDWKEILFDHAKLTKYPLLGKHKDTKCEKCHTGDLYKDKLLMTCVSCHKKDDDKIHKGNFGVKCESCHVERSWKEILFNHDKQTKYPLLGKHKTAKCSDCHKGDIYKDKTDSACITCHEKDDKHKGQEGKKCETCHNSFDDWKKTTFKHNTMSKFPLLGAHAPVACKECHKAVTFKDAKSDCWTCHEKDDAKIHKRRFGTECQECHNFRNWKSWDFDHNKTQFKLDGPHKNVTNCYACHQRAMDKKVFASKTCGTCHDRDDVHNGDFGAQCDRCHTGDKWKDVRVGVGR